jgi:hypothetical protein
MQLKAKKFGLRGIALTEKVNKLFVRDFFYVLESFLVLSSYLP